MISYDKNKTTTTTTTTNNNNNNNNNNNYSNNNSKTKQTMNSFLEIKDNVQKSACEQSPCGLKWKEWKSLDRSEVYLIKVTLGCKSQKYSSTRNQFPLLVFTRVLLKVSKPHQERRATTEDFCSCYTLPLLMRLKIWIYFSSFMCYYQKPKNKTKNKTKQNKTKNNKKKFIFAFCSERGLKLFERPPTKWK